MKKYLKITISLAFLAFLGFAPMADAGPFYPYFFNPYYYPTPQIIPTPFYPAPNPQPNPTPAPQPTPTPLPFPPQIYPTPTPTPLPYPYFPNTPQVTPVAPMPYYPTPTPQPTPLQFVYINITDAGFNPDVMTIQAGTTVIWKNLTTDMHGVIDGNGMFTNYNIYPAGIHAHQFLNSGTYIYKDSFNGAVGQIIVQ